MASHASLQNMRVAPRDGHPRVAATLSGSAGRSVSPTGVVYYSNDDDENDGRFKLMDDRKEKRDRKEGQRMAKEIEQRNRHARKEKGEKKAAARQAWDEGGDVGVTGRGQGDEWEESFDGLATSVRKSGGGRPQSANPRGNNRPGSGGRPKSAHGNSGSISTKVKALEDTVTTLQQELQSARELVESTVAAQKSNDSDAEIDTKLAEKLAVLRRDQERNVKVIEELVRQRDTAQAKARRLEQVLVKEVDDMGLTVDPSVPLHKPQASSFSPKKQQGTQRPGETDEEFERRIKRRHQALVKPFKSMEVHEAVTRRNKIKKEEEDARKKEMADAVVRAERERMVRGMDATEFSFAVKDRERQRKKEEELDKKRQDRKDDAKALQFRARPVKLCVQRAAYQQRNSSVPAACQQRASSVPASEESANKSSREAAYQQRTSSAPAA
jgi:hypothetical protein